MTTYIVTVRRRVEEIAEIEVEADSADEARQQVEQMDELGEIDNWEYGNDTDNFEIVSVKQTA